MAEESVAEGLLARLEEGGDVGDVLRADIERRDGVFFDEWTRTTDGWQGIATPAGGAGTAEEPPPRRVRRDDPHLHILIYVISDLGLLVREDGMEDESGLLAYVNLIRSTFSKAQRTEYHTAFLSDKEPSAIGSEGFLKDMDAIKSVAKEGDVLYDQIHFIGHGVLEKGILFDWESFNASPGVIVPKVDSLPLKPEGVIVLVGCYSKAGPFYDWAFSMVGLDDNRIRVFEPCLEYNAWEVEEEGELKPVTDWYAEGNESLMDIHDFLGLEKEE
jgi:hypothetical protein